MIVFVYLITDGIGNMYIMDTSVNDRSIQITIVNKPIPKIQFALSSSYWEQQTNALYSMWSLQKWANVSGFRVVEPFAYQSSLGLTGQLLDHYDFTNVLYFSDYFDLDFWTKMTKKNYGIPPLEKWNTFALYPFKKTVVVIFAYDISPQGVHIGDDDINKDHNCVKMRDEFYGEHAKLFNRLQIQVVRNVCFVFNGGKPKDYSLSLHQFNSYVIQNNDSDVHVWFSAWRGIQYDRIPINDHEVLLRTNEGKDKIQDMVKTSQRVLLNSRNYVNNVLNAGFHGYTTVAFRTGNKMEVLAYIQKYSRRDVIQYFHKCAEEVKHALLENPSEPKFLSIDLGKFGDMTPKYVRYFKVNDDGTKLFKFVLNIVYGNKSIDEYENELIRAANGIEDSGYIGAMQKTIAENAKHLIVVGGYSNFQASMIMKFKAKTENCQNCTTPICYVGPKRPWQQ